MVSDSFKLHSILKKSQTFLFLKLVFLIDSSIAKKLYFKELDSVIVMPAQS
jgi:hypothetical protein